MGWDIILLKRVCPTEYFSEILQICSNQLGNIVCICFITASSAFIKEFHKCVVISGHLILVVTNFLVVGRCCHVSLLQIDGSTLRTLCMQHGPLPAFHLYLSQGIALVRYSTREEAAKAQSALNNCVLGNTTIFADFANENDIQQFLQQSGHSSSSGGSSSTWGPPTTGVGGVGAGGRAGSAVAAPSAATTTASSSFVPYGSKVDSGPSHWNGTSLNLHSGQLWSLPTGTNPSSLWGSGSLADADQHRATPSSLTSFLPGDLLGGESVWVSTDVSTSSGGYHRCFRKFTLWCREQYSRRCAHSIFLLSLRLSSSSFVP